jgi:hypothetical protein
MRSMFWPCSSVPVSMKASWPASLRERVSASSAIVV